MVGECATHCQDFHTHKASKKSTILLVVDIKPGPAKGSVLTDVIDRKGIIWGNCGETCDFEYFAWTSSGHAKCFQFHSFVSMFVCVSIARL